MTFQFDWFSLIFVGVLLFYLFMGLRKGFLYVFLYFIMPAVLVVVAIIAAKPLANILDSTLSISSSLHDPVYSFIAGINSVFEMENPGRELLAGVLKNGNYEMLVAYGIPTMFAPVIAALILSFIPVEAGGGTIAELLTKGLVTSVIMIATAVLLFIVLNVGLIIVKKVVAKRKKAKKKEGLKVAPNLFSRILGMVSSGAIGVVMVFFIVYLFDMFCMPIEMFNNFIKTVWVLDDPYVMTIGKWIYLNNPLEQALIYIFKLLNI